MPVTSQSGVLLPSAARPRWYLVVKRLIDMLASAVLLLGLLPVMALCALIIRLDSRGPVFFWQQRVGECGKLFTLIKFRTMQANADSAPHRDYVAAFIQGRAKPQVGDESAVYKLIDDGRITHVGHWLRRTSLDELPQLWNVLKGDMSLVGPRPPIPYELDYYQPAHYYRLTVKPGITGPWQVYRRSTCTFEEMVAMDIDYIRHSSLLLELVILLKTILVVFQGKGAH